MIFEMMLAGAAVTSSYKEQRVGHWLIVPEVGGCVADAVYARKSSVNIRYGFNGDAVLLGVSDPDLTFVQEGKVYKLRIAFRRSDNSLDESWGEQPFFGGVVGGMNALIGRFKSPLLSVLSSSTGFTLALAGKPVTGYTLNGGAAMIAALKECAAVRQRENPS